jgi:hypothetical protein
MKENSITVFEFIKAAQGVRNITAADIAGETGIPKRSVDGIVTSALQRKGLAVRTEQEVEVTDDEGKTSHKKVKYITLTDEGLAFVPEAD